MAEFCKQCSEDVFGEDFGDFKGLAQNYGASFANVLCEGCGPCRVDNEGRCVCHGEGIKDHGKEDTDLPQG